MDVVHDILLDHRSPNDHEFNPAEYLVPAELLARLREAYYAAGGEL